MNADEKAALLDRLKDIDIVGINEDLKRVERELYKKGLTDWVDMSWEHPDPKVSAAFGDLHKAELDERHGFCSPYLDSCQMCNNPACHRTKDDGWTCLNFMRATTGDPTGSDD